MVKTQFILMEPKLILKILYQPPRSHLGGFLFFFTNQVATYYSNSITRLPKFSTHFQQSLYVLLPGQQSKRAFTFIELVGQREGKLLQIDCASF